MTAQSPVRPIEASSVTERVTAELRRSIIAGDLAPGQTFSLREISAQLDVSFIPVREALRNLEAEGLVLTRPGRSAQVAPLDLTDLQAIYRLRRTIEPEIARNSCGLLTDADLDRLEAIAEGFAEPDMSYDRIFDSHMVLHLALFEPVTTTWDLRVLTTLWRAAERYVRIGFGKLDNDPHEHTRRAHAHHELIDAFRTRDPEKAAEAMRAHLERNEQIAMAALSDGD